MQHLRFYRCFSHSPTSLLPSSALMTPKSGSSSRTSTGGMHSLNPKSWCSWGRMIFFLGLFGGILLGLLVWDAELSWALVDMSNGGYTAAWIDLQLPGTGYDLNVTRSYRSQSLRQGIFGFGWCSDFETKLDITPEGNLSLKQCGDGRETHFFPRQYSKKEIRSTVQKIVNHMLANNTLATKKIKEMTDHLMGNEADRGAKALQFHVSVPVKEGMKYLANGQELDQIVYSRGIYTRNLSNGTSQRFDKEGHLIQSFDRNGNFLKHNYRNDLLVEVVDNNGRRLSFTYENGKVKSILGPNGLGASYKYRNDEDLVWVENQWKKVYTFKYDEVHNLLEAIYPDGTSVALTYNKNRNWVIGFKDRRSCTETYKYENSKDDPKNHYWSRVEKVCDKKVVNQSYYEFWFKKRDDGQAYYHRFLSNVNGEYTDVVYDDVFGKPLSIQRNKIKYTYKYRPDGLVDSKTWKDARIEYSYNKDLNKVAQVKESVLDSRGKAVSQKTTTLKYDPKGNPIYVANTDGQKVTLAYDHKGRIVSILDQAHKVVRLQWSDKINKPVSLERPGVGSIQINYKSSGEMAPPESKDPTVAMQIVSTFNNYLAILSPVMTDLYD